MATPSTPTPTPDAPLVSSLGEWTATGRYASVPDDWHIVITDVEGSTRAIAEGRYKQVNAVGVASIVAVANACGGDAFPFVFGGDGATLAMPPEWLDKAIATLEGLRARTLRNTGLRLRVGAVSVGQVRRAGGDVRLAWREMPAGFRLALFSGGGLTVAEALVKAGRQEAPSHAEVAPPVSVEGLECRWNDIPSRHGRIMSLLVRPRGHDLSHLAPLLALLESLGPGIVPVHHDQVPLTWPPRHLATELAMRADTRWRRTFKHAGVWLLTGLFSRIVRRQSTQATSLAGRYLRSLGANADHVKLDDTFRAVLDLRDDQAAQVEALLGQLQAQERIDFGLHYSDHALMTCFVRNLDRHLHFVDGGDGGYAMAAVALKRSLEPRAACPSCSDACP